MMKMDTLLYLLPSMDNYKVRGQGFRLTPKAREKGKDGVRRMNNSKSEQQDSLESKRE